MMKKSLPHLPPLSTKSTAERHFIIYEEAVDQEEDEECELLQS